MTSTGICVGLNENTRSSSRVLRPPGGGHTNIFGGENGEDGNKPARKDHGRNASSILEGTNSPPITPVGPQDKTVPPPPPIETQVKTAPASSADTQVKTSAPLPQISEPPASAQAKGRVPPGGFSSGLW